MSCNEKTGNFIGRSVPRRYRGMVLIAIIGVAATAVAAQASTITFQAGEQPTSGYAGTATYVRSDMAGTMFGNSYQLLVGNFGTNGTSYSNALLDFPLTGLPSNAVITSATLTVVVPYNDGQSTTETIDLDATGSFSTTSVDYNTTPPAGTELASLSINTQSYGSSFTFTGAGIGTDVQTALNNSSDVYLELEEASPSSTRELAYFDGDTASPSNGYAFAASGIPTLTVNYTTVPEPATLGLFAAMGGAVMVLGRRRRISAC